MSEKYTYSKKELSELIDETRSALGLTENEIVKKFHNYPVDVNCSFHKGEKTRSIQVYMIEKSVILSFHFNQEAKCYIILIKFDEQHTMADLVGFLNVLYPFDYTNASWNVLHCRIRINNIKDDIFLIVRK